jgi:hypothetical protein
METCTSKNSSKYKSWLRSKYMVQNTLVDAAIATISDRSIDGGGFTQRDKSYFNSDATAWASLALKMIENKSGIVQSAVNRLVLDQRTDGCIISHKGAGNSYWPTSTVALCLKKCGGFESEITKAIQFILSHSGEHWDKKEDGIFEHDTSLRGWPWVGMTHSWIEPTSMALLALRACGYTDHSRVKEAVRMIMDRQLPEGGWNYGNTGVFGKTLRPIPESTGHALTAIAGLVKKSDVALSINYLKEEAEKVRTPLSLSWTVFGLSSWHEQPKIVQKMILESLQLQDRYGVYDTSLISQLLVAYYTKGDLLDYILSK